MEREEGGGFRLGSTCTLMADSRQCMAKPIQYCDVKLINFFKKETISRDKDKTITNVQENRPDGDLYNIQSI